MTNEEAKRIMEFERDSMCNDCYPLIGYGGSEECDFCTRREAYESAIFALEKTEKCKWHDLRENPEDLPKEEKDVLCVVSGSVGNVIYEESYVVMYYDSDEKLWIDGAIDGHFPYRLTVLAWREIEFEEE